MVNTSKLSSFAYPNLEFYRSDGDNLVVNTFPCILIKSSNFSFDTLYLEAIWARS